MIRRVLKESCATSKEGEKHSKKRGTPMGHRPGQKGKKKWREEEIPTPFSGLLSRDKTDAFISKSKGLEKDNDLMM